MTRITTAGAVALLVFAWRGAAQAYSPEIDRHVVISRVVLSEMEGITETRVPSNVRAQASCVAVFPNLRSNNNESHSDSAWGVASCKSMLGWSAPIFLRLIDPTHSMMAGGPDIVLIGVGASVRDAMSQAGFACEQNKAQPGPVVTDYYKSGDTSKLQEGYLAYSIKDAKLRGLDPSGLQILRDEVAESLIHRADDPIKTSQVQVHPLPSSATVFLGTVSEIFH